MIISNTITQTRDLIKQTRIDGKTVGLVPTMGGLHEGHFSLIRQCQEQCDFSAVSIFVNPTQFGPNEDFDKYPRTFDTDCDMCRQMGVDLVFAPSADEMYPQPNLTWVNIDKLTNNLCGASRPTHFRGVCTVVIKLFNIVQPDVAYFGEKDAQQLAVITRMVADLNLPITICPCPTVRDTDGLAFSSRNQHLTPDHRRQAPCLYHALCHGDDLIAAGQDDTHLIINEMKDIISQNSSGQIDYISIVDKELLRPIEKIDRPALIALAVYFGDTRLIDNFSVDWPNIKK